MDTGRIIITIPLDLKKALRGKAGREDKNMSEKIVELIKQYVGPEGKKIDRDQIARELMEGCPKESRKDHLAIAKAIRAKTPTAEILDMPETQRWIETYVWLKGELKE